MYFTVIGSEKMNITYNNLTDVLYIRLNDKRQKVINKQIAENIVLDVGEDEKLVGIEIINASKQIKIEKLSPLNCKDQFLRKQNILEAIKIQDELKKYSKEWDGVVEIRKWRKSR